MNKANQLNLDDFEKLKLKAEDIYHKWDKALANNDVNGLLSLYAHDAVLESPLVRHL